MSLFSNYHSNDLVSVFQQQTRKEELTRVEREAAKTKLRIDVYRRLRYVESDHVVFDPITGREVPAERTCINKLIEALVDESNDISKEIDELLNAIKQDIQNSFYQYPYILPIQWPIK